MRAGILEQSTVDLLREIGLGGRLDRDGDRHRVIYLQWPGERHHLDFVDLVGRSVWVYGQTEVQKDLVAAAHAGGRELVYDVSDTALHDLETDHPSVTFTDAEGASRRIEAEVVVGCDGSFGPSRSAIPTDVRRTWERTYPASDDPFDRELQRSQLQWIATSEPGAAGLAENCAGLPIGF